MSTIQQVGALMLTITFVAVLWIWLEFGQPELLITWFIALAGLFIQHQVND